MQVRISETYDLSTKVGKMGFVAIHTPDMTAIARRWGGLIANHKFVKLTSCDVTMACASMLPADPLQVGLEAGSIAPQDMFNPILYTAVSNDSFNNIINRIMLLAGNSDVANQGSSVDSVNSAEFGDFKVESGNVVYKAMDDFQIYYSLLSQNGMWKKSMPQSGLQMKGLYPVVYSLVNTIGNQAINKSSDPNYNTEFNTIFSQNVVDSNGTPTTRVEGTVLGVTLRGQSMRMPAIPTWTLYRTPDDMQLNPGGLFAQGEMVEIPKCYVASIIMPPAKLNQLFYRMRVTWTIEFIGPRPYDDIIGFNQFNMIAEKAYGTDYAEQASTMSVRTSSVDASGADVQMVMEGA